MALKILDQSVSQDQINTINSAHYALLDALGVTQHHDSVTGTAKQAVANDYNLRLFKGMEATNTEYAKLIDEKVL